MRLFIEYSKSIKRLKLDISDSVSVALIKLKAAEFFELNLSDLEKNSLKFVLVHAGCELQDAWIVRDIEIRDCSTLKCTLINKIDPEFYCIVKFKKEKINLYDTGLDKAGHSTILELRIFLSNLMGLPLSIFRLKTSSDVCMYDNYTLKEYYLSQYSEFILETWNEWDDFLQNCIKGLVRQVIDGFNDDVFIKQFQMRVALYIAAFYGNQELATKMIQMGVRPDKPVGEHPCRQWCQNITPLFKEQKKVNDRLELEKLKCPIHVAVSNGQLKIVMQMFSMTSIHVLQKVDGFGVPPWRLALRNRHKPSSKKNVMQKEIARYLLGKTFDHKVKISNTVKVSVTTYCKLIAWAEKAKEKIYTIHGPKRSSLPKNNISIYKTGLLGNKVLMDGFNNDFKDYINSYDRLRKDYKYYYFIDDEEKARRAADMDLSVKKSQKRVTRKVFSKISDYSDIEAKVESWNGFSSSQTKSVMSNTSIKTDYWNRGNNSYDMVNSINSFSTLKESVQDKGPEQTIAPLTAANLRKLNRQKQYISFDSSIIQTFNTFGPSSIELVNLNTKANKKAHWMSKGSKSFDSASTSFNLSGKTSSERAKESLKLASQFRNKTFLQQVKIGSKIAMDDFRKSLQTDGK